MHGLCMPCSFSSRLLPSEDRVKHLLVMIPGETSVMLGKFSELSCLHTILTLNIFFRCCHIGEMRWTEKLSENFGARKICIPNKRHFMFWSQAISWSSKMWNTFNVSSGNIWFWMRPRPLKVLQGLYRQSLGFCFHPFFVSSNVLN